MRDPAMARGLPDMAPFTCPVRLTARRERHSGRRIRLLVDRLAETLCRSVRPA